MLVVCQRWVGDEDRLQYIDPSSDQSSTSSSSLLGLLNRGSLRAQSPQSAAGSHLGILSPTGSNFNWFKLSVSCLYFCLTSTCFRFSSAYLHECISWLTAHSRVNMLHLEGKCWAVFLGREDRTFMCWVDATKKEKLSLPRVCVIYSLVHFTLMDLIWPTNEAKTICNPKDQVSEYIGILRM